MSGDIRRQRGAAPPARSERHRPAPGGAANAVRAAAQYRDDIYNVVRAEIGAISVKRCTTPSRPSATRASSGASSPPGHRPATRTGSVTTTTTSSAEPAAGWSTSTVRWATPVPDGRRRLGLRGRRSRGHLLGSGSPRVHRGNFCLVHDQPSGNTERGGPPCLRARARTQQSRPRRPSRAGPGRTGTGGRTSWTCRCSISTRQRQPDGRGLQLRRGVQDPRPRRAQAGRRRGDDDLAGLVAGGLRPLRAALHPDDLARSGHLPHRRRPGRRQPARSASRPSTAGRQRQPRQGPPAALAGQAEVRPEDLLGRPDRLRRQRRPGVDGVPDVRLRLRAGGHLGAEEIFWGSRTWLGDEPLQRRQGARRPLRRRADGPHLREPGGPNGNPDPLAAARDIRETFARMAMDDEEVRRSSSAATPSASATVRSIPRYAGPEPEGCPIEGAGHRLEEHLRHRQGRRHAHQRAGGRLDQRAGEVGPWVPRQPVQVRLRAHDEPGRCSGGLRPILRPGTTCPTPTIRRSATPP